jgi:hypothetical protein
LTFTPVACAVNAAIHAACTLAWAEEPPAVIVPDSELRSCVLADGEEEPLALLEFPLLELLEQPARAATVANAATPVMRGNLIFTVILSGADTRPAAAAESGVRRLWDAEKAGAGLRAKLRLPGDWVRLTR